MLQNLSLNLQVHKEEHTSGSPSQPRSLRGQVGAWRLTARLGHTFGRSFAFLDLLGKKYLLTYSSDTHNFAFPPAFLRLRLVFSSTALRFQSTYTKTTYIGIGQVRTAARNAARKAGVLAVRKHFGDIGKHVNGLTLDESDEAACRLIAYVDRKPDESDEAAWRRLAAYYNVDLDITGEAVPSPCRDITLARNRYKEDTVWILRHLDGSHMLFWIIRIQGAMGSGEVLTSFFRSYGTERYLSKSRVCTSNAFGLKNFYGTAREVKLDDNLRVHTESCAIRYGGASRRTTI